MLRMLVEIEENNKITLPSFVIDKLTTKELLLIFKGNKIILEKPREIVDFELEMTISEEDDKFIKEELEKRKISMNFFLQEKIIEMLLNNFKKLSLWEKIKLWIKK